MPPGISSVNLSLSEDQTIGEIQRLFTEAYQFLKIEFYKALELNGIRIMKKMESTTLLPKAGITEIDLSSNRTIAQVKADFNEATGLIARIFRKSGNVWIETSLTDDWTLDRQNAEGRQIGMV